MGAPGVPSRVGDATAHRPWPTLAVVAGTLLACLPMLAHPMGADQAFYAYGGWVLREGGVLGVDWWAQTPPLFAYLCALSQILFGHSSTAIRGLDLAWSVATALSLAALVRLFHGARMGALAALLWAWSYSRYDFWHSAQVDGFLTLPVLWVLLLAHRGSTEGSVRAWWWAGAVLAQAFMIKYIALACLAPVAAMLWVNRSSSGVQRALVAPLLRLGGGFALGLAPWVVHLGLSGSLASLGEAHRHMSAGYTTLPLTVEMERALAYLWPGLLQFVGFHAGLLAIGGVGLLALRSEPVDEQGLAIGWLSAAVLGYAAQLKGFLYHSLPVLGPLALLGALGLREVGRFPRWIAGACLGLLLTTQLPTLVLWGRGWADLIRIAATPATARESWHPYPRFQSSWSIAERIRAETTHEDTIFVWGYEPLIPFLAHRRSASRFVFIAPFVVPWADPAWREELLRDLRRRRPSHIIVCHEDATPWLATWVSGLDRDSASLLEDFPELQRLIAEEFSPAWRTRYYDVYRRRASTAPPSVSP